MHRRDQFLLPATFLTTRYSQDRESQAFVVLGWEQSQSSLRQPDPPQQVGVAGVGAHLMLERAYA